MVSEELPPQPATRSVGLVYPKHSKANPQRILVLWSQERETDDEELGVEDAETSIWG
jgi:hypothetical protein